MSEDVLQADARPAGSASDALDEAARLRQAGRADDAEKVLRQILQAHPLHADAHQRLLELLLGAERFDDMQAHARSLVERAPQLRFAWTRLCQALLCAGQDAVGTCEAAAQAAPDDPQLAEYLGVALRRARRLEEAEQSFRRSLALRPGSASTWLNLANVLSDMGRLQDAAEGYAKALELDAHMNEARYSLAVTLIQLDRRDDARRMLQQVVAEAPDFALAHGTLGMLESESRHWPEAEASLRRALELNPGLADAHFYLATTLLNQLRPAEAGPHLQEAIRLVPIAAVFHASQVVQALPAVPASAEEADGAVGAFDRALQDYAAWRAACPPKTILFDIIERVPFLLAYREGNHRELLSRYADEVGPPRTHTVAPCPPMRPKLRLGVVSEYFRRHSVWYVITKGILSHLDRSLFEICLYNVGAKEDDQTDLARSLCDRWVDTKTVRGPQQWVQAIAQDQPDVLFYPEVGSGTETYLIARERLAPVQAASWGHPITSGLATVDLYFSGELLEPPQADSHYRERLVRLPGTGACTVPLNLPEEPLPLALAHELAAHEGATILVPQMPFKFDPRFDTVLARIVEAVGRCQVLVPQSPTYAPVYAALAARLGQALRARGLDPDAVFKLIPWVPQNQFNALLDQADVVLDCTAFSGYTTAWIAAQRGAPMVTLEGPFLRQRLTAGLYRAIGITDTIVDSDDAYVRTATALALEGRRSEAGRARRRAIRAAAASLDADTRVVRAFEHALVQAVHEAQSRQGAGNV
jgi:predicted O-linked N-acetylglucosamine transferase (SPINDLY family)